MKKIAVISATRVSLDPVNKAAAEYFPDTQIFHIMDEGMSALSKVEGCISGRNLARMVNLIRSAEDLGVEGILLSCTVFSPYTDLLQNFTKLPLVAADVAMFEKAVLSYKKFGVIVTFGPTIESVTQVLNECRKKTGREFEAVIKLADGAFQAAAEGDDDKHNKIVVETIKQFPDDIEAVVLSQMSQMRALPLLKGYRVPVLSSPPISLGVLAERIEQLNNKG